uniref:Integrase catalytic domain-containing protein n=1 Tax=Peronospora matthiolae TaxID=2874970 RepID=A0AAV1TWV2_9STRA
MPDEANVSSSTSFNGTNRSYLRHLRLGHIGHNGLDSIVKKGYGIGINITEFLQKSPESAKKMLEVIHSDVCGPMQTASLGGSRYFVTFFDEYLHFSVVFLLKNNSEVASKFAEFVAFAETQTGNRVKLLRSDNGGEYKSHEMTKLCSSRGIVQKFTPPYTPQLIVVAERMNRTLVECALCMLEHAELSKEYWGEAVVTATFL